LEATIMDLRVPLDLAIYPVKAAEALERTRIALLGKAVGAKDAQHRMGSMLREHDTTPSFPPAGEAGGSQRWTSTTCKTLLSQSPPPLGPKFELFKIQMNFGQILLFFFFSSPFFPLSLQTDQEATLAGHLSLPLLFSLSCS
jgi:hypothetical protein